MNEFKDPDGGTTKAMSEAEYMAFMDKEVSEHIRQHTPPKCNLMTDEEYREAFEFFHKKGATLAVFPSSSCQWQDLIDSSRPIHDEQVRRIKQLIDEMESLR